MLSLFTTLLFAGAFAAALYAIGSTLLPALPRIAEVLLGAELAARVPVTEPRRAVVRVRSVPAPVWSELRAAA
ncbi:hypothetical protein BH09PSE4_BH09PSE4_23530 [soil metagenome]